MDIRPLFHITGTLRKQVSGLKIKKRYSGWFLAPTMIVFITLFIIPLVISFYFSLTVWSFTDVTFVGLENFRMFLKDKALSHSLMNTFLYSFTTCGDRKSTRLNSSH